MNLYKFTSASVAKQVLDNLAIRFTPPSEFNDAFEVSPYIQVFSEGTLRKPLEDGTARTEMLAELARTYDTLDDQFKKTYSFDDYVAMMTPFIPVIEKLLHVFADHISPLITSAFNTIIPQSISDAVGFLCLVRQPFSELMWAHYADSHRGVALVFHEGHSFFQQNGHSAERLRKLRPIIYSDVRPAFNDLFGQTMTEEYIRSLEEALFFTKSAVWSYEEEVRCARPQKEADIVTQHEGKLIHLFKFDPSALQGVVLGTRCSKSDRELISGTISSINATHGLDLKVSHVVLHEKEYRLNLLPYRQS